MVHVLTDDYHQNVCTNSTSTPIIGKINVPFLTSTCDTKYASSPVVRKLQYDITPSYNMTSHKHPFYYAENSHPYRQSLLSTMREFNFSLQLPFRTFFTQTNIGYRQHGQKKCTVIVPLQPIVLSADKSFETKQHKIPQKYGVFPTFTCMQANTAKLRKAFFFTTFVVNASI